MLSEIQPSHEEISPVHPMAPDATVAAWTVDRQRVDRSCCRHDPIQPLYPQSGDEQGRQ